MGSEKLAANLFRITQTESKLKRDNISTERKNFSKNKVNVLLYTFTLFLCVIKKLIEKVIYL